jgi:hypothetical protein
LWAYGGENFYAPSASKICLPHISTTICKGNAHGLMSILKIHKKNVIKKYIFQNFTIKYIFQKIKIFISKKLLKKNIGGKIPLNV